MTRRVGTLVFARLVMVVGLLCALLGGCRSRGDVRGARSGADSGLSACPAHAPAPDQLPNTPPEIAQLDYWLAAPDRLLVDVEQLAVQHAALTRTAEGSGRVVDLARTPGRAELEAAMRERLGAYAELFAAGSYESDDPRAREAARADPRGFVEERSLHVALAPVDLRCIPVDAHIRSRDGTARFDRNACSRARPQEPIELLGRLGPTHYLARTRNAFGFVARGAALSPEVPRELEAHYRAGPDLTLSRELTLAGETLPSATLLRRAGRDAAFIATATGFVRSRPLAAGEARPTRRPLTRHAFLKEAFRYLGTPYGWGDQDGGRDCSRFVLDVLASFGVALPRTSAHQRESGRYTVDVPSETSPTERLALLDEAHERGLVLVHFPGHIMFYLGRDRAGVPRVLHSFAEYLTSCAGGGETAMDVDRVSVSDLSLGAGTSRGSFLERITHLTVLGDAPGYELLAFSRFRAPVPPGDASPRRCRNGGEATIFTSPSAPDPSRPLRAIAVSEHDLRPAALWLVAPDGTLHAPPQQDLGVGPYARWVEVANPMAGKWRVLLADGASVHACTEQKVGARARPQPAQREAGAAWRVDARWSRAHERLYAAFVEQLFSHPIEDMRSWSSLSELLRKPERNLLFDHLGLGEDTALTLSPDCADLPYLLRASFAYKLGLPFAFHRCTRGKAESPPRCRRLVSQADPVKIRAAEGPSSELARFEAFWRVLRDGVHSASGRTLPDDPASDLYPLPLTREALAPGATFIDPYGHMVVVAKWYPQGLAGQAMLMGADAQPDATVGRRRFWRGNFLFTPETRDVGAGFKAFRPVVLDEGTVRVLDDAAIAEAGYPAPSRQQYEGDLDAFYARMDELIYPRPVAVEDRMKRAVDALEEQVRRRVEAVDVGEAGLHGRREPVAMPEGYAIFETSGPWEDFATPSRDLRLLIAVDAVRALPADVRAAPARFGVEAGDGRLDELDRQLATLLAARRFSYTRSDGSSFSLSLADVVARAAALEVAYNPNDCPEVRWGAPPASDELRTCERRAPEGQRALLERYRPWFRERRRPPRP